MDFVKRGSFGLPRVSSAPLPGVPPRYQSWLADPTRQVPRRHHADLSVQQFLSRGEPVVLTGCCPLAASLRHWCLDHLLVSSAPAAKWPVHFTPSRIVSRTYGDCLGTGGIREVTLAELATTLRAENCESPLLNHYLQAVLIWASSKRSAPPDEGHGATHCKTGETAPLRELERRAGLGSGLERELDEVDWKWLEDACAVVGGGTTFQACQMWFSTKPGCVTPCHYDGASNFVAQLQGVKHFLLFPPHAASQLYPYPVGHPMDNFAMCEPLDSPDLDRFPRLAGARGHAVALQPGEVLWLPAFWWHHVQSAEPSATLEGPVENLSINFWCAPCNVPLAPFEWLSQKGTSASARALQSFWLRSGSRRHNGGGTGADGECTNGLGGSANGDGRHCRDDLNAKCGRVQREWAETLAADSTTRSPRGWMPTPNDEQGAVDEAALEALLAGAVDGMSQAGVRFIHACRMAEGGAVALLGSAEAGARFLCALAAGEDDNWAEGSALRSLASRIREELAAVVTHAQPTEALGVGTDDHTVAHRVSGLVLRTLTCDGRLHPGLAPPWSDHFVASERGDVSTEDTG